MNSRGDLREVTMIGHLGTQILAGGSAQDRGNVPRIARRLRHRLQNRRGRQGTCAAMARMARSGGGTTVREIAMDFAMPAQEAVVDPVARRPSLFALEGIVKHWP